MSKHTQKFEHRQSMKCKTFEVFHYYDAKPQKVSVHHHDFYEIYFFLGGDVSYWIEGKTYKLEQGDLLLISPMKLHQPIAHENIPYKRIVLWIDRNYLLSKSSDKTDLTECFNGEEDNITLLNPNAMMRGRLAELLELLARETRGNEFGSNHYAEGLFLQLMVEINRIAKRNNEKYSYSETPSLVNRVVSYINDNYNENISLDMLAKRFFVSKYHLSHEFGEQIGIGVYKYLTFKRLTVAKELLVEGHTATEVCERCGFHNYATFYRIFKAKYGMSPSDFTEHKITEK